MHNIWTSNYMVKCTLAPLNWNSTVEFSSVQSVSQFPLSDHAETLISLSVSRFLESPVAVAGPSHQPSINTCNYAINSVGHSSSDGWMGRVGRKFSSRFTATAFLSPSNVTYPRLFVPCVHIPVISLLPSSLFCCCYFRW